MSLDSVMVSVLRLIHSEICKSISADAGSIRTHVASRLLEAAHRGKKSERELKLIGRAALLEVKAIDDPGCAGVTRTAALQPSEFNE
jgi:hypothetical protein